MRLIETCPGRILLMLLWFSRSACMGAAPTDSSTVLLQGTAITSHKAFVLETGLRANPDDWIARAELIGYYSLQADQPRAQKAIIPHIFWMIRHRPDTFNTGLGCIRLGQIDPDDDPAAFEQAKRLWKLQIHTHPNNAPILYNAATFFFYTDERTAERWLRRGEQMDTNSPAWPSMLGYLYDLQQAGLTGAARRKKARQARVQNQLARRRAHDVSAQDS